MSVTQEIRWKLDERTMQRMIELMRDGARQAGKTEAEIDEMVRSMNNIDRGNTHLRNLNSNLSSTQNILGKIGPAMLAFFAVDRVISMAKSVVELTGKFQTFEAVLTNTLGSKSAAKKALDDIQVFARTTPFSVDQSTAAFLKLTNNGIKPTLAEMRSFADLSANAGKDIDMFAEAVNDATRGEFERLKEFFISAKTLQDKYVFTFKNQTFETEKNAIAVKNLLVQLGQLNGVAGATEAISQTVTGKLSAMGDQTTLLAANLGNSQSGLIGAVIDLTNNALEMLNNQLKTSNDFFDQFKKRGTEAFSIFDTAGERIAKIKALSAENKKAAEEAEAAFKDITKGGRTLPLIEQTEDLAKMVDQLNKRLNTYKDSKYFEDIKEKVNPVLEEMNKKIADQAEANKKAQAEQDALNKKIQELNTKLNTSIDLYSKLSSASEDYLKSEADRAVSQHAMIMEKWDAGIKDYYASAKEQSEEWIENEKKRLQDLANARQMVLFEALETSQSIADAIYTVNENQRDRELNLIEQKYDRELELAGDNDEQRREIERAYEEEKRAILAESAEAQKKLALFNIATDTAAAIVKALASAPPPFNAVLAALVGAAAAAQAIAVTSTPVPGFKDGVFALDGPGTETSDSINSRLSKGESVVSASKTKKWAWALKPMIEDNTFTPVDLVKMALKEGIFPAQGWGSSTSSELDYDKLADKVSAPIVKAVRRKATVNITIDSNRHQLAVEKGNDVMRYLNEKHNLRVS